MTRVFVAVGEIIYLKIVFTKILNVTRANERATLVLNVRRRSLPSPQLKVNLSHRKLSKAREKKDSRIKRLGTESGSESEASNSSHYESSGDEYHRDWPMFSVSNKFLKKEIR